MKTCPNCKTSYTEDDKKFCKKCGTALATVYSIPAQEIAKKTVFEDRLKADPLNVDILHEFVQFLFANNLFDETIHVALKILALSENDLSALEILLQSYVKLRKLKEAIEFGKQLLQLKPTDIELLTTLAEIYAGMDLNNEVLAYYDRILKLDPANQDAHFKIALILLKENEIEKAIKSFKEAFALGNNDRITSIYLGIDKALNEDYESAIRQLTPLLTDSFVNSEDLNYNRGFLYLAFSLSKNTGDLSEIINWLNKCDLRILKTKYDPLDESAWISVVKFIIDHRLSETSLSSESKIKIDILAEIYLNNNYLTSKNNKTIAEIWYNIGREQTELDLFEDAVNSYGKCVDLQPNEMKYKEAVKTAQAKVGLAQKKKQRKTILGFASILAIVALIVAAVFAFNYMKEKHAWENAMLISTEDSFKDYLLNYHSGRYADQALELQDDAAWNEAKSLNTIESCEYYLNKYHGHTKEAEELKEEAVWNKVLLSGKVDEYLKYYQQYPDGKHVPDTKKVIGFSLITVEKLKNDLLGRWIPNWNFDYLSEFIQINIAKYDLDGNQLSLFVDFKLQDGRTKELYYAKGYIKYDLKSTGNTINEINGYYYSKNQNDYLINNQLFIIGKWRWKGNSAEYFKDGTWKGTWDDGNVRNGRWCILDNQLLIYLNDYNNLWLNGIIKYFNDKKVEIEFNKNLNIGERISN
jgi:tetratricopeptide (TPR) repeat protein